MHLHHSLVQSLVDERQRRLQTEAPLRRAPELAPVRRRGSNMPSLCDTS